MLLRPVCLPNEVAQVRVQLNIFEVLTSHYSVLDKLAQHFVAFYFSCPPCLSGIPMINPAMSNIWKRQYLNPEPLGVKPESYLWAMPAPIPPLRVQLTFVLFVVLTSCVVFTAWSFINCSSLANCFFFLSLKMDGTFAGLYLDFVLAWNIIKQNNKVAQCN